MQKPFLRVIRLNKISPEVNNLFPGIKSDRKLYDMGTYTVMHFVREGHKLVAFDSNNINHVLYGPSVVLYRVNNGVYTPDEVEIVSQREIGLENLLFDIQAVFPNQIPSNLLGTTAGEGDRAMIDISVREARKSLRQTPRMRYHRFLQRRRNMIRMIRRQALNIIDTLAFVNATFL